MSENNCAVYVHVNLINGKKYFGITTQNPPERRWSNGNGYKENTHFSSAIKKYGWNNFGHFVLYRNIPIKIAKNMEEMLIREHMSHDSRFGYNKTYGGELEIPTEELLKLKTEQFGKPVIRFDKNTGEITGLYESVKSAGRITGIDHSYIIKVCKCEREAAGGSCWCYVSEVME